MLSVLKLRHEDKLAEALTLLAHELHALHNNNAILKRIDELESNIMSKISEFAQRQNAFNDQLDTAVEGLTADVKNLNDQIAALQNSTGGITAEDQALLDAIEARSAQITTKLAALDSMTPPAVPTTP